MESLIQKSADGDSNHENRNGEESVEDGTNHHDTCNTCTNMCPPVQKVAHKIENSDEESEDIQGPEAIKIVKEQISQILVSKYVKKGDTLTNSDESRQVIKSPVHSVKQQISKFLFQKYADQQKSLTPERNSESLNTVTSEKSMPETEIHADSDAFEQKTLINPDNLIEGYSISDFETDEQIAELNRSTTNNDIDRSQEVRNINEQTGNSNLVIDEPEDKSVVIEMINSLEEKAMHTTVTSRTILTPHLCEENVTFQEISEFPVDESNLAQELISEENIVNEQDIKPEMEKEMSLRKVSGPAAKVTLDLSTISTLSNIWDKSYRNVKRPNKSSMQYAETSNQLIPSCNLKDTTDNFQIEENTSTVSEGLSENITENNVEAKGIHNLQISESLKLKLMNLQVEQPLNEAKEVSGENDSFSEAENNDENTDETEMAEQEGIECLRLSESLKQKLLNIKNMKKLSKDSESKKKKKISISKNKKALKIQSQGIVMTAWKRKVGRPRKIPSPLVSTSGTSENMELVKSGDQDQISKVIDNENQAKLKSKSNLLKRKVGRPKLQKTKYHKMFNRSRQSLNPKLASKLKHSGVKPKSQLTSEQGEDEISSTTADGAYLTNTLVQSSVKRKVGRPPKSNSQTKIKEIVMNNDQMLNLKPCFVKLTKLDTDISCLNENGMEIDTNTAAKILTERNPGKHTKTSTGKMNTVKDSFKSKLHGKRNSCSKQKTSNKEIIKQKNNISLPINESTLYQSGDIMNSKDVNGDDVSAGDKIENDMHAGGAKQEKDTGTAEWEDDWHSDVAEGGDSSDDYHPSDQESDEDYMPKKKGSFKKPRKIVATKIKSEAIENENINNDKENHTKIKKTVKRQYTHKGPRIGRPPVLGEFPCTECDFVTYEKNLLQKHIKGVHQREWMNCEYCDFSTRSKTVLLEHEGKNHTNSKPFRCDHEGCSYASNVHNDYQKHISQAHTENKPYQCPHCDYSTRWRRNVRNHILLRHNDERNFVCNICNQAFKRKTDLKQHIVRHSDEKPLQCDVCGFRCKTNWEMKSHKLAHSDVRNYPCTFPGCTQACKTKSDLTKHMVRHETERNYHCPLCPNKYKCKAALRKHQQYQHTTTRDFHCECGKSFKTKSALKKHGLIHSDVRPFYCDICGSGHTTKNNMEKHKLTHRLDELPFHCPICPFGAKIPNALLAHIGAAHGDSYAYYCELCRKPFKKYAQLRRHCRRMHGEEESMKLGNTFEIDLALMKTHLDLDDTFEALGVSPKKKTSSSFKIGELPIGPLKIKREPFDAEFHQLEDISSDSDLPGDEEFEAMERELNNDPELSNDITDLKKTEKSSKNENNGTPPKKRGRPKKNAAFETTETVSDKNIVANDFVSQHEIITDHRTVGPENVERVTHDAVAEINFSEDMESIVSLNKASDESIQLSEAVIEPTIKSVETVTENSTAHYKMSAMNFEEEIISEKSNADTTSETNILEHSINSVTNTVPVTVSEVDSQETDMISPRTSLKNDIDSISNKNLGSGSNLQSVVADKREGPIFFSDQNNQTQEQGVSTQNSEAGGNHSSNKTQSYGPNESKELETINLPQPFFFEKTEQKFSATIALYEGFKLPLATKGFAFNYDKFGSKPKSWFMEPSYMMDPRARERQLNFMRLEKVRAKLIRRAKPVYKDGKKAGRAFGYKFSKGYNYKCPRMLKFLAKKRKKVQKIKKKIANGEPLTKEEFNLIKNTSLTEKQRKAEEETFTTEELKQIKDTPVFDRQKRKASFKGNYAEADNLDENIQNDVKVEQDIKQQLTMKEGNEIPRKKRKMSGMLQDKVSVKKKNSETVKFSQNKVYKKSKKRKTVDKSKQILLYSEKKKPRKNIQVRKPGFLDETYQNNDEGQENMANSQTFSDATNTPTVPKVKGQKRKPGRKPKDPAEKKPRKNSKAQHEPVQPKYKYVKRSQQKKMAQESAEMNKKNNDNPSIVSDSAVTKKRKSTAEKPDVKKAKMSTGKKMQVKFTRNPKQTAVNQNSQLSMSSSGMLHEAIADSNLVRVHLPQNVSVSNDERIAIPGLLNQQTGLSNIDMRHVVQGGKCLMYCDDVVVMKDLSTSQEIFGLGVNQIKSETFIEPVEPFSANSVFATGAVVNPVHPILLTQASVGNIPNPEPIGSGMIETHANIEETVTDDRLPMLRVEGIRESGDNLSADIEVADNAAIQMNCGMINDHVEKVLVKEASTDQEVMQLDYSVVKDEPDVCLEL